MEWSCTPAYNNGHVCNLGGKKCCHRFGRGRKKLFALQFASELISFRDIFSTILYCWLLLLYHKLISPVVQTTLDLQIYLELIRNKTYRKHFKQCQQMRFVVLYYNRTISPIFIGESVLVISSRTYICKKRKCFRKKCTNLILKLMISKIQNAEIKHRLSATSLFTCYRKLRRKYQAKCSVLIVKIH